MKTALIAGSTGLTGSLLLSILIKSSHYERIVALSRKPLKKVDSKVENLLVDFENLDNYKAQLKADDVFCCIGTTIRKAGSIAAFRKVDLDIPKNLSRITFENGAKQFLVVSSIGTKPSAMNYYIYTKHEMETEVQKYSFDKIAILRPSLILGDRKEKRLLEDLSGFIFKPIGNLLSGSLKKYRPIEAQDIATAMHEIANSDVDNRIYESDMIQMIADTAMQT